MTMAQPTSHNRSRDKPILSCNFCRGRKLRCDRQSPCSACLRRNKPEECMYTSSEQERKNAIDYRPHAKSRQTQRRIARLESLVTEMRDMAGSQRQPTESTPSLHGAADNSNTSPILEGGQFSDDAGQLSLTEDHTIYTGSSHWVTILEEIRHLKDELTPDYLHSARIIDSTPFSPQILQTRPASRMSLLDSAPHMTREQILAMIPPRKIVDRHVSHFFNAFDMATFILHRNKFLAEYESFWADPSTVPIMWVGLLFSVMSMSALLQQQDVKAFPHAALESHGMLETYRMMTINCLIAGDYMRPSRHTIETLTLHFAVEQNLNSDAAFSNWILIGVVIRIALRMGLHRDPSHWPAIRPLQAELRRRLWITLYQMDFFTSTQVGLPRIVKDSQCDTRPPALSIDFEKDLEQDLTSQEWREPKPTSLIYIVQRNNIIKVAAEIYDATEAAPPTPATRAILALKLEQAIESIPTWLKYRSAETSIADSPVKLMHQMFLDILVQKAIYLLHRRSFMQEVSSTESTRANELCIEAGLAILEHQRKMHEETQPGGLMAGIRWKVVSSLSHEFLQATMLLCFALSRCKGSDAATKDIGVMHRYDDILHSLKASQSLWQMSADKSVEAQKAADAISTVLQSDLDDSTVSVFPGLSDQMTGIESQSYLGGFSYGGDMTLDPSLFTVDTDVAAFGSMLDDFVNAPDVQD